MSAAARQSPSLLVLSRTLVLAGNPPVVCNDDAIDWYGLPTTHRVRAQCTGTVRLQGLELVPRGEGKYLTLYAGSVHVGELSNWVPAGARILVADGQNVQPGAQLASWEPDTRPVLAIDRGIVRLEGTVQRPKNAGGRLVVGREGMHLRLVRRGIDVQHVVLQSGTELKVRPGQACMPGALMAVQYGNFAMLGGDTKRLDPVEVAMHFLQFPDLDRGERLGYLLKALGDAPERLQHSLPVAHLNQLKQLGTRTEAFAFWDDNPAKTLGEAARTARQRAQLRFRRGFHTARRLWA